LIALRNLLLVIGLIYLVACGYLWLAQRSFIFQPSDSITETPTVPYSKVWIQHSLAGWWLPASPAAPVLLYLHGNGLNIGANAEQASRLRHYGFSVLVFDYRGYGLSQKVEPSEEHVYQDAESAWNYLVQERHISPERIFIYGHSLGGAIAIELARRHPEAKALIVESSFTSMAAMVTRQGGLFNFFPVVLLLNLRFDSLPKVKSLQLPVLFIHGTGDNFIPYQMSQALSQAAPGPKFLTLIPGGGHATDAIVGGVRYQRAILDFVNKVNHSQP